MPAQHSSRIPSYRHHKPSGQAFVELAGHRHYMGKYGTSESKQKYHATLAEWSATGRVGPPPADITIAELAAAFWEHAQGFYRHPDGAPTSEVDNFRQALRPLKALYADSPVTDFGPRAVKAVRQNMVDLGWCRTNINKQINRLRHVFRWGVEQELVPPSVYHGLQAVTGLKRGRCEARESEPVRPVPQAFIDAIKPHVSRQVWGLVQLQLLCGARAGELVNLRAIDIDTSGKVWTAKPEQHKTAHHGHQRTLYFGPRAQQVLAPFLAGRAVNAPLFSPREAEAERHAAAECHRRPNQKRNPRKTERVIGNAYDVAGYRRAIARGCRKAKVDAWHPHRLRHNAGTALRKEHGLEAARVILGHRSANVTEIYAELDHDRALDVIAKVG